MVKEGHFDSRILGKLRKSGGGKYELFIGNHVLEGKSETLKKPLLLVYPSERVESFMGQGDLRSAICNVHGVVREKIVFKSRPNIAVGEIEEPLVTVEYETRERLRS